jgi:hypothetical protein
LVSCQTPYRDAECRQEGDGQTFRPQEAQRRDRIAMWVLVGVICSRVAPATAAWRSHRQPFREARSYDGGSAVVADMRTSTDRVARAVPVPAGWQGCPGPAPVGRGVGVWCRPWATSGAPGARPTGTRPGFSDQSAASVRSNESETISDRAQLLALTAATRGRDVATKHAVSALGSDRPAAVPPYVQEATLPAPGTHPSCATGASTSTGSQRPRQGAGHRWYRGPERR